MDYITDEHKFSYSYRELKDIYNTYVKMSDEDFTANLPKLLHFVVFVCFIKEHPASEVLGDRGIIHQIVHLMDIPDEPLIRLEEIRAEFNEVCKLV